VRDGLVSLFLCGDVMLGRGVDQILPHPGDPTLREPYVHDARTYVALAEAVNGPIPHPVDFSWPWGDVLRVLDEAVPDARVINLETSITRSDDFAPEKVVHYRMNPANLPALAVARPDTCVLANNHVMDFGRRGLAETLDALASADLQSAGAGWDVHRARQPAIVTTEGGGRVLVFSYGAPCSGTPPSWAATEDRPGVSFLADLSTTSTAAIVDQVRQVKQPTDVAVASIHWGSNWGYDVSSEQIRFAHDLVDGGVDILHGHSSHHPRPIEVYRDKLILYGCGDFIDDYEGITGHEEYRDDLRLPYLVSVKPETGALAAASMVPMQARQMRLWHASRGDVEWLRTILNQMSGGFGVRVDLEPDGTLALHRIGTRGAAHDLPD
jgi:poly-gamma-glutamate synthesis protein (capsule biosynthesis protein)